MLAARNHKLAPGDTVRRVGLKLNHARGISLTSSYIPVRTADRPESGNTYLKTWQARVETLLVKLIGINDFQRTSCKDNYRAAMRA